jgi:hypothetical protein
MNEDEEDEHHEAEEAVCSEGGLRACETQEEKIMHTFCLKKLFS